MKVFYCPATGECRGGLAHIRSPRIPSRDIQRSTACSVMGTVSLVTQVWDRHRRIRGSIPGAGKRSSRFLKLSHWLWRLSGSLCRRQWSSFRHYCFGWDVKLTTYLHLVPMLRMNGVIPPPPRMSSWSVNGKLYILMSRPHIRGRHAWSECLEQAGFFTIGNQKPERTLGKAASSSANNHESVPVVIDIIASRYPLVTASGEAPACPRLW